jgi:hypothetical protein
VLLARAAQSGRDIALSADAQAAYRRYAIRANRIWQASDQLHLWQYWPVRAYPIT